jgi:hypothetical protein
MLELANKDITAIIKTVSHMSKKLNVDKDNINKIQVKLLKSENYNL